MVVVSFLSMAKTTTEEKTCVQCGAFMGCSGGGMSSRDPAYDEACRMGPSGKCVQCRRDMRDYSDYI